MAAHSVCAADAHGKAAAFDNIKVCFYIVVFVLYGPRAPLRRGKFLDVRQFRTVHRGFYAAAHRSEKPCTYNRIPDSSTYFSMAHAYDYKE